MQALQHARVLSPCLVSPAPPDRPPSLTHRTHRRLRLQPLSQRRKTAHAKDPQRWRLWDVVGLRMASSTPVCDQNEQKQGLIETAAMCELCLCFGFGVCECCGQMTLCNKPSKTRTENTKQLRHSPDHDFCCFFVSSSISGVILCQRSCPKSLYQNPRPSTEESIKRF